MNSKAFLPEYEEALTASGLVNDIEGAAALDPLLLVSGVEHGLDDHLLRIREIGDHDETLLTIDRFCKMETI